MPVVISMLRGVNVGGHNKIKMDALRTLYESLKFTKVESYVQSGNVVFHTKDDKNLAKRIEDRIERDFGFRPSVILRTADEMRAVIANNPFAKRDDIHPGKLLVHFLPSDPGASVRAEVLKIPTATEELHMIGRELYVYFPNGQGKPGIKWAHVEKALSMPGTGRNWNSVTALLAMAERMV